MSHLYRAQSQATANTVVVLDFETTGLSPRQGARSIEIGAVRIVNGQIRDRFQRLMNPGFRINRFIENYTGISNAMLRQAPPCAEIMAEFAEFIAQDNLVAHNAAFDQRFLEAELDRIQRSKPLNFACSMLLARRLCPEAPNHKLGSLVAFKQLPSSGVFHRALADAEMTAELWLSLLGDLQRQYRIENPSFALMQALARQPRARIPEFLRQWQRSQAG